MKKTLNFSFGTILRIQKKQCSVAFLAILFLFAAGIRPVSADSGYVQDMDGQLEESEEERLEQACEDFREAHGFDIYILTVSPDEVGGSTEQDNIDYVEAFTDERASSGAIALLINMDFRYYYLDVTGEVPLEIYTDSRQEDLESDVREYLSYSDVSGAAGAFVSQADDIAASAENSDGTYDGNGYESREKEETDVTAIFVVPAVIAAIASLILLTVRAGMHHQKKEARDASAYIMQNSVSFPVRQDVFISQYETRVPVSYDDDDGHPGGSHSGTHTHVSSGGHTHSGGGGHF